MPAKPSLRQRDVGSTFRQLGQRPALRQRDVGSTLYQLAQRPVDEETKDSKPYAMP